MKILDVDQLQAGLTRNIDRMNRLEQEISAIQKAVEGLIAMEDALKGEGGQAIRDFYTSCHLPFLQYFLTFKEEFNTVLQQAQQALASLEPVDAGHIVEEFLETDVEKGLTESAEVTATLTDEANAIMDEVSDIIGLTKLDDTLVQESIADAKKKRNDTVEALHTFDSTQTIQLTPIETSIQSMKEWVQNIEGLFKEGLTDVDFPTDKWTSMAVGSDITKQLTAMGMSVGNILGKDEAASLIEQAVNKEFVVDEYNEIDKVSDIAGTYYTLADGRILREFYGPSGALTYTFVERIPKEKVGGAIESGEKFFSWMSTIADFVPGVSNAKAAFEGIFGVNPITGDKISGLEQGIALAAIFGGPLVKLGKGAVKVGGDAVGKIKNVLHPDKAKEIAKKAYEDYIQSPLQKGYTYAKDYLKKLGDVKTSLSYKVATPQGNIKVPMTVSEVAQNLKESAVQMAKKLDEMIGGKGTGKEILSSNGSFIDSKLESNYENYLARKAKEGKLPKDRLEWKEARDYWLNDSPMARGNKFNSTVRGRDIYDYHEIHLENGKRLDSYDPFAKEIISRKATDLDMIDEKTYKEYLKEMTKKYSVGIKIRSNAYPELDGKPLEGKLILEIPATNKNISDIERYKQIAKDYEIELRFMEE